MCASHLPTGRGFLRHSSTSWAPFFVFSNIFRFHHPIIAGTTKDRKSAKRAPSRIAHRLRNEAYFSSPGGSRVRVNSCAMRFRCCPVAHAPVTCWGCLLHVRTRPIHRKEKQIKSVFSVFVQRRLREPTSYFDCLGESGFFLFLVRRRRPVHLVR